MTDRTRNAILRAGVINRAVVLLDEAHVKAAMAAEMLGTVDLSYASEGAHLASKLASLQQKVDKL